MASSASSSPLRDAAPGLVLLLAAVVSVVIANSALAPAQAALLKTPLALGAGPLGVELPVSGWIKNALMAIFFFYAGLELKHELREGALSTPAKAAIPAFAALGGMTVPAALYLLFARDPAFVSGWAIPAATDIAFALGVLSLLGSRVPAALKAFLLAVAVVDDLGAILIVAFVYTETVSALWLAIAAGWAAVMAVMNRARISQVWLYLPPALALWFALQHSGVNPTVGGVLAAAFIPMRDRAGASPVHRAESGLRPWVLFGVMPVFALANAGVSFQDGFLATLSHPVALGVAAGLAIGKPLGITALTLIAARALRAPLPGTLPQIVGVGWIAGIGFTMSLFIGALAFADPALAAPVRAGVYVGSITAAIAGLALLAATLPQAAGRQTG